MSFLKAFSIKNLGHYVAVVAHDIVKFGAFAKAEEPLVEGVTAMIAPDAVALERAGNAALGYLVDAADKLVPVADGTQTLTLQVAASEVADFKALAAYFKSHAAANGVTLPASGAPAQATT
jgi:hypothetical protein